MRINPDANSSIVSALDAARTSERKALSQLASGRRFDAPSEAPGAAALLIQNQARMSRIRGYSEVTNFLRSMLATADSALGSATTVLTKAIGLGVEGGNSTQNAEDRHAIAEELRGVEEQMLSIVNTTYNGVYLFSGTATNKPAFSRVASGNIVYEGSTGVNHSAIGENEAIATSAPGSVLFDSPGKSVFAGLHSLILALDANNTAATQDATSALRSAFEQMSSTRVFYGSTLARLATNADDLSRTELELAKEEESLTGADLAQTITDLTQAQTAIQAILTATGKTSKLTLFDYIV